MCYSVFFFKQKTAYEIRISDWSSDVCSSDRWSFLRQREGRRVPAAVHLPGPHACPAPGFDDALGSTSRLASSSCQPTHVSRRRRGADRKSAVQGTRVSLRVYIGGLLYLKKQIITTHPSTLLTPYIYHT